MNKGLTITRRISAILGAIAVNGALYIPASAQIRVDAPLHSSYESCLSCDLSNKRLNGMKLENTNFAGSFFNNSNLSGGKFHGADLTGAHFRKALLYRFQGDAVKLAGAIFEDATLTEASVTNSTLHKIDLNRATMTRANFSQNDFRAAILTNAQAVNANLSNSNFENAILDDGNFQDTNLTDSNFKNASFGKAILLGSQLQGTNLSGADLSNAQGLSQAQLDTACGNVSTQLPHGLFLPFCSPPDILLEDVSLEELPVNSAGAEEQEPKTFTQTPINQDPLILGFGQ
ncbi:MAG: pentapeptide repeat-containing protein [Litorimonas sp.]